MHEIVGTFILIGVGGFILTVLFMRFAGHIMAAGIFLLLLLGLASKPQVDNSAFAQEIRACQRPDLWIDRCSGIFWNADMCRQQCATKAPTERTDDPHAQALRQLLGTQLTPLN